MKQIIPLWKDDAEPTIARYSLDDSLDRPAMLVIPGGGYSSVCHGHEGRPIADRFLQLGFQVFVLNYHVRTNDQEVLFPKPQRDALRAMKLIRANASTWHVIPNQIAVLGFSAGGHLAASIGILHQEVAASAGDEADTFSGRPDATVLAYPVLSGVSHPHIGSVMCLYGPDYQNHTEEFSLERRVDQNTPPAFLWHTLQDQAVPYQNSTQYLDALAKAGVPCECHILPLGLHGRQLGYGNEDVGFWPEQAKRFLIECCHFTFPRKHAGKCVILTFDDAVRNHCEFVAPELLKRGFGATFFISRMNDIPEDPRLMTPEQIRLLERWGFDIGNHTYTHPCMDHLDSEQNAVEIEKLNSYLAQAGVSRPVNFAYPGGPYPGEIAETEVDRHAFRYARIVENRPWDPETDSRFKVPCYPVHACSVQAFADIVEQAKPGRPVVVVFHGVPDYHPHVTETPENFIAKLDYLKNNGFDVISFRDFDER